MFDTTDLQTHIACKRSSSDDAKMACVAVTTAPLLHKAALGEAGTVMWVWCGLSQVQVHFAQHCNRSIVSSKGIAKAQALQALMILSSA